LERFSATSLDTFVNTVNMVNWTV